MTCGFAACFAERLRLSVVGEPQPTSSAPSGRLSLPDGAEREEMGKHGRKGEAFPHSRGRSPHERRERLLIWTAVRSCSPRRSRGKKTGLINLEEEPRQGRH